ncbi:hypothetical protein PRIPAC_82060 [Pristionchus pacificus]|uniref:Uncharacterized protein n=1 Tax=Pristionchus pacificus TaxID=54126 RepID=A0A2A6C422_PRIPA|nr:hypothetical protein PRIPAC_82060 [Pristionchus pacificus]|eukprot:PDM72866.1 hypothetical protein PRIPAC_39300 [Pristionchus pacificus]
MVDQLTTITLTVAATLEARVSTITIQEAVTTITTTEEAVDLIIIIIMEDIIIITMEEVVPSGILRHPHRVVAVEEEVVDGDSEEGSMTVNGITITIQDSTLNGIMIGNGDNTDKIVIGEEDPRCSRDFYPMVVMVVEEAIREEEDIMEEVAGIIMEEEVDGNKRSTTVGQRIVNTLQADTTEDGEDIIIIMEDGEEAGGGVEVHCGIEEDGSLVMAVVVVTTEEEEDTIMEVEAITTEEEGEDIIIIMEDGEEEDGEDTTTIITIIMEDGSSINCLIHSDNSTLQEAEEVHYGTEEEDGEVIIMGTEVYSEEEDISALLITIGHGEYGDRIVIGEGDLHWCRDFSDNRTMMKNIFMNRK